MWTDRVSKDSEFYVEFKKIYTFRSEKLHQKKGINEKVCFKKQLLGTFLKEKTLEKSRKVFESS
jgi:hypothetical protein